MINETKDFAINYTKIKIKEFIKSFVKSLIISIVIYSLIYFIFDIKWWTLLAILAIDILVIRLFFKLVVLKYFKLLRYTLNAKKVYNEGKDVYDSLSDERKKEIKLKLNVSREKAIESLKQIKLNYGKDKTTLNKGY